MQMTGKNAQRARDDLLRAIKRRITELTLSLISQPANAREISLAIRDLERLPRHLSPIEQPAVDSPLTSYRPLPQRRSA